MHRLSELASARHLETNGFICQALSKTCFLDRLHKNNAHPSMVDHAYACMLDRPIDEN